MGLVGSAAERSLVAEAGVKLSEELFDASSSSSTTITSESKATVKKG